MKIQTSTNIIIRSSLLFALALTLVIWSSVPAQSVEPGETMPSMEARKTDDCQKMMQKRQKMMDEMKAQDIELNNKVAKMNSAPEDQKLGMMAEILTLMVEQRSAMHAKMEKMQPMMMKHMMGHMKMGKESMENCPMMKDMEGMKEME